MLIVLIVLSCLLILLSVLPFIQNQHWIFRVAEFLKMQLLFLQMVVFITTLFFTKDNPILWYFQGAQFLLIVYHIYILMRYTKFWKTPLYKLTEKASDKIKIISCNIYQYNEEYHRFIALIHKEKPDIFLTMESNIDWEKAMRVLEKDYPNYEKVTLENTYGMHFYTKLKINRKQTHYFVADDSIHP